MIASNFKSSMKSTSNLTCALFCIYVIIKIERIIY